MSFIQNPLDMMAKHDYSFHSNEAIFLQFVKETWLSQKYIPSGEVRVNDSGRAEEVML